MYSDIKIFTNNKTILKTNIIGLWTDILFKKIRS